MTQNVLKCTACKGAEFRNTVLTKCYHSQFPRFVALTTLMQLWLYQHSANLV
jgi:hypothetical protein